MKAPNRWFCFVGLLIVSGISIYRDCEINNYVEQLKTIRKQREKHQEILNLACSIYCNTSVVLFCKENDTKDLVVVGCADNDEPDGISLDTIPNGIKSDTNQTPSQDKWKQPI